MEIKLNKYTIPLLCFLCILVTIITWYIIKRCTKEKDNDSKKKNSRKFHHQNKDKSEEEDNIYDEKETEYYKKQSVKRKDSIFITKKRMSQEMNKMTRLYETENEEEHDDPHLNNKNSSNEGYNGGQSENGDPAEMLEERLERSRKFCAEQQRDVIVFEDELQDIVANEFNRSQSSPAGDIC